MRTNPFSRACFTLFAFFFLITPHPSWGTAVPVGCQELVELKLPDVRITEAVTVQPGDSTTNGITASHCKVAGIIGREIGFELLLPDEWNGRFVMGGGGGFVGSIQNSAAWTLTRGYATVGTDTGHRGTGVEAGWALHHPERQVNFGHLAVHRTAEVAKAIVRAHYGSEPEYSYFMGCSRGGGQALMEAQRYPEDFDGIVAGAPAMHWPGIAAEMVQNVQKIYPDPSNLSDPIITLENLRLLETSVLAACDALDGIEDGVMDDPRACTFDLDQIPACASDQPTADCFTEAQRTAIEEVYAPATAPDGTVLHTGQPFGGEGEAHGWQPWITGPNESLLQLSDGRAPSLHWAFGTEIYKYLVFGDSTWDYTAYDFSDWAEDTEYAAALLNATDPDLGAFKDRRGKLILWHGWSDPALSALASIAYYEQAEALDPELREYFRLFLMPGVLHCGAGPGPDQADWMAAIADWVERDVAPDRIIATKSDADGTVLRTRPLCPYPQQAVYAGSGSTDEAENFVCRVP